MSKLRKELLKKFLNENSDRKCTEEKFKLMCDELLEMFIEKNKRYKNSLEDQFDEFGVLSNLTRISDKVTRLKYLILESEDDYGDESLEDTLKDLSNYVILTLLCVRGVNKEKEKEGN